MRAFHNSEKIKQRYIEQIKIHQEADEIVKGVYWENGKGCAVGCTLHSNQHSAYETELGIPGVLAHLEDRIFENLPNELAKKWPLLFLESIAVGADLSKVWAKFAIFLLTDVTQCNARHPQCSIVANCFEMELSGEKIDWRLVRSTAAADAATYAADAATYAADAATYAADAATYAADAADAAVAATYAADAADAAVAATYAAAAAVAATYAADAATYAAAAAAADAAVAAAVAAGHVAYIKQSEKLLELLRECK